jgi:ABC-2 type transport system permease protein
MLALYIFQLIFLSFGFLMSAMIKNHKQSGKITLSIFFTLYMASVFVSLSDKVEFLKYFTPFKYFEVNKFVQSLSLDLGYLLLSFVIIIVCTGFTFFFYSKRDLTL